VVHSDRGSQGGFKWSSQHLEVRSCDGQATGMGCEGDGEAAAAVSRSSAGCAS
jgi:putative transposase